MILDVPFTLQTTPWNCGPVALHMIFSYFGNPVSLDLIEKQTGIQEGKCLLTIQLATAVTHFGYRASFFSKQLVLDQEHLSMDYYQKHLALDSLQSAKAVRDAQEAGVHLEEKRLSLEEILAFITLESVPVILLDWNVILGRPEKGYQGHFVPVIGYDKDHVFIHNHGLKDPESFMHIKREVFDQARKSFGTDEDLLVIYKK